MIRLSFPALTEERRKEYVKVVKHMAEDGRVAVRNLRRDARKHLEALEKAGEMSADELERAEKELDKITHDHVEKIDVRWAARKPNCSRSDRPHATGRRGQGDADERRHLAPA